VTVHSKGSSEFVAEATEIVDILGRDLLALDKSTDSDTQPYLVNGIFRAAHSLKGLASMFGQDRIAQLAHKCEDLLDNLRLGRLELSAAVLNALVEAVEVFQALLEEADIKLSSLVSDLLGLSARRILQALAEGETDAATLATLADQRLRATPEQLRDALGACTNLNPSIGGSSPWPSRNGD